MIGLTGPGGVGKTTTAEALTIISPHWSVLNIGTPIKDMLAAFYTNYGLESDEIDRRLHGNLKRHPCPMLCGKSPTHALQTLGTEWGRQLLGEDIWLNWWASEVAERLSLGEGIVNDNVRFGNEVEAIRNMGGIIVELYGRGNLARDHISERGVEADYRVKVDNEPMEIAYQIREFV